MSSNRSKYLAGVAFAALIASAPMALAQNSPETGQGSPDEMRLDCESEFRALQETLAGEPEFTGDISERFGTLFDESTIEAEAGVCFVNLIEARQMLADEGLVLANYTDDVTIFDSIEEARAAGMLTEEEATAQTERARVIVEARPARVAVTPKEARVMIEREATQVAVNQRPAEITVEQPQTEVTVQQPKPEIDVSQPAPEVNVQAPAPEVQVVQPQPEVTVQQAAPEIAVKQAQPKVIIEQPKPKVTIKQFQPEVSIVQPQPKITVQQEAPEVAVVQPEPEVEVVAAQPIVTVEQAKPQVQVEMAKPEVNVTQRQPEVQVSAAQPQVTIQEEQPEVTVTQSQPQVTVEQDQPQVSVQQDKPEVQVSQEQAKVSATMGEAQVSVTAEEGVDVQATREEGVAVTVEREDAPEIVIAEAAEMPEKLASLQPLALEEVEFQFDSAELTDIAIGNLQDAIDVMTEDSRAVLIGYASPIGNADYNLELSRNRVMAVRDRMVEMGIDPSRIVYYAAGENDAEQPSGEASRSEENRRVEIRILPASAFSG